MSWSAIVSQVITVLVYDLEPFVLDGLGLKGEVKRFTSVTPMNEAFRGVGLDIQGVQCTHGELKATVASRAIGQCAVLSTSADQRLWFTGSPPPGMTVFAVMRKGSSWYHGDESVGTDLCGFRTDPSSPVFNTTDIHFDGELRCIYLPRALVRYGLEACNSLHALTLLETRNALSLTPYYLREFNHVFDGAMAGTIDQSSLENFILLVLQELAVNGLGRPRPSAHSYRYKDVLPRLYALAHQKAELGEKVSLTQIGAACDLKQWQLHEIAQVCGISIREMFLNTRLEQVRHALLTTDASCEDAAVAFGFHPTRLARPYTPWAGETPLQTKQRGTLERCWLADSAV